MMNSYVAAWYARGSDVEIRDAIFDIQVLETRGFNLFFLGHPDFAAWDTEERNAFIDRCIRLLRNPNSEVVLPLFPFIDRNAWYQPGGMEAYVARWGTHPNVNGFLLYDDYLTAPWPPDAQMSDPDALWVMRWHYRMIRNIAEDQDNSFDCDLAPGKRIYVTANMSPRWNGTAWDVDLPTRIEYGPNTPDDIYSKGGAWDVCCPYWYPNRSSIGTAADRMNALKAVLQSAQERFHGPLMPIIQAVGEDPALHPGDYLLVDDHLKSQYAVIQRSGILERSRSLMFYSTHGHFGSIVDLLTYPGCSGHIDDSPNNRMLASAQAVARIHARLYPSTR